MQDNSNGSRPDSYRDDLLGDVLVIDPADLPTLDYAEAVFWMAEIGLPHVGEKQLKKARQRSELAGSLIGNKIYFSKRELIEWVESRKGIKATWGGKR